MCNKLRYSGQITTEGRTPMPNFHKITVWHEIFAGVYFWGSLEKPQKLEPAKISFTRYTQRSYTSMSSLKRKTKQKQKQNLTKYQRRKSEEYNLLRSLRSLITVFSMILTPSVIKMVALLISRPISFPGSFLRALE